MNKEINLKICSYVIENGIKLLKKNKINKINVLLLSDLINIEIDDNIYIISNMISYKAFIDIISKNYKIILKYIPKLENNNLNSSMEYVYKKYKQANISIINNNIENKYIV